MIKFQYKTVFKGIVLMLEYYLFTEMYINVANNTINQPMCFHKSKKAETEIFSLSSDFFLITIKR